MKVHVDLGTSSQILLGNSFIVFLVYKDVRLVQLVIIFIKENAIKVAVQKEVLKVLPKLATALKSLSSLFPSPIIRITEVRVHRQYQ